MNEFDEWFSYCSRYWGEETKRDANMYKDIIRSAFAAGKLHSTKSSIVETLSAEVERLRGALERIADYCASEDGMAHIAREALTTR